MAFKRSAVRSRLSPPKNTRFHLKSSVFYPFQPVLCWAFSPWTTNGQQTFSISSCRTSGDHLRARRCNETVQISRNGKRMASHSCCVDSCGLSKQSLLILGKQLVIYRKQVHSVCDSVQNDGISPVLRVKLGKPALLQEFLGFLQRGTEAKAQTQ